MNKNKTHASSADVMEFLQAVDHPGRREDGLRLDQTFRQVTGFTPQMWGPTMIGYGSYDYTYESGRQGTHLATGFSPRKANMVLYIMPVTVISGIFCTILARTGGENPACIWGD